MASRFVWKFARMRLRKFGRAAAHGNSCGNFYRGWRKLFVGGRAKVREELRANVAREIIAQNSREYLRANMRKYAQKLAHECARAKKKNKCRGTGGSLLGLSADPCVKNISSGNLHESPLERVRGSPRKCKSCFFFVVFAKRRTRLPPKTYAIGAKHCVKFCAQRLRDSFRETSRAGSRGNFTTKFK